jgi:L-glyceraldehyde 3-phosphate reductase
MYMPDASRYTSMVYRRSGNSGIKLPAISLGLWHNFGGSADYENARALVRTSFDLGITHFDLANNYGPPPGSAEESFGRILKTDLAGYRDELIISSKAGYGMWDGPYGDWGSRKYLISSLDQSLKRMGLDYVDIFYHHRPDPDTPLEETMTALDYAVRSGRALYAAVSNYPTDLLRKAAKILRDLGTPCLIHQPKYSMVQRQPETTGLLPALAEEGIGSIVFSPLAQGVLSDRYLQGIPEDSRIKTSGQFLKESSITPRLLDAVRALDKIAQNRGQSLAQMALAWVLRPQGSVKAADGSTRTVQVTSALIGASKPGQIVDNVAALAKLDFSADELAAIDAILSKAD